MIAPKVAKVLNWKMRQGIAVYQSSWGIDLNGVRRHAHYSASECIHSYRREDNICASLVGIVCLTSILVNIEDAFPACLPLNISMRIQCTSITFVFNF